MASGVKIPDDLSARLAAHLDRDGLTCNGFARLAGLSGATVQSLIDGRRDTAWASTVWRVEQVLAGNPFPEDAAPRLGNGAIFPVEPSALDFAAVLVSTSADLPDRFPNARSWSLQESGVLVVEDAQRLPLALYAPGCWTSVRGLTEQTA